MSGLPGILGAVEELAGVEAALQLAREYGGTQISLSDAPGALLVRLIGQEAASAIVQRIGRGKVVVPMATARGQKGRRAQAAALLSKDATATQVALACDMHTRTVWRVKKALKEDGSLPLFDRKD